MNPIGPDDVALNITGRPVQLPVIYKAKRHPQRGGGNVFYYIQDVSPTGMQRAFEIEEKMKIPHGPGQLARKLGEYLFDVRAKQLLNYNYRFLRDKGQ
jgi:hypothetical protein